MYTLSTSLTILSIGFQDGRGYPKEDNQAGRTECSLSTLPREERQIDDCRLEVGSQQDPSRV